MSSMQNYYIKSNWNTTLYSYLEILLNFGKLFNIVLRVVGIQHSHVYVSINDCSHHTVWKLRKSQPFVPFSVPNWTGINQILRMNSNKGSLIYFYWISFPVPIIPEFLYDINHPDAPLDSLPRIPLTTPASLTAQPTDGSETTTLSACKLKSFLVFGKFVFPGFGKMLNFLIGVQTMWHFMLSWRNDTRNWSVKPLKLVLCSHRRHSCNF